MEILKLKPATKDYLWGGRRLADEYHKITDQAKLAETWELSVHKDGNSIITNGPYENRPLGEYMKEHEKAIWGTKAQNAPDFPILIKFIDAKQALSIQVHPDDEYARKVEGESGKNEFWYVLEAQPDAFLYYGVKKSMTKDEFRSHIEDDTVCDYLKKVPVKKGDCFFIEAGTIHAIGAGIVICEIQQSSNSTYRVYDFGRKGVDGKPRELHIDKAVDVANLVPNAKKGEAEGHLKVHATYDSQVLTQNNFFTCTRIDVQSAYEDAVNLESFQALTILEGRGLLTADGKNITIRKGDSIFIPAQNGQYHISGDLSFIKTTL